MDSVNVVENSNDEQIINHLGGTKKIILAILLGSIATVGAVWYITDRVVEMALTDNRERISTNTGLFERTSDSLDELKSQGLSVSNSLAMFGRDIESLKESVSDVKAHMKDVEQVVNIQKSEVKEIWTILKVGFSQNPEIQSVLGLIEKGKLDWSQARSILENKYSMSPTDFKMYLDSTYPELSEEEITSLKIRITPYVAVPAITKSGEDDSEWGMAVMTPGTAGDDNMEPQLIYMPIEKFDPNILWK